MRPSQFSDEEIINAGLELSGSGVKVTGYRIRKKLGGGNVERFKKVWHNHCAQHGSGPVMPAKAADIDDSDQERQVTTTAEPTPEPTGQSWERIGLEARLFEIYRNTENLAQEIRRTKKRVQDIKNKSF